MKKVVVAAAIGFSVQVNAQVNLVPNPSFEDTIACPYQAGDIDSAVSWTSFCGSPDLFSTCNQFTWGVPTNGFGFQSPASGTAYAGFISFTDYLSNFREFPSCTLSSPLTIGTKYYVSFKVALSLENVLNPTNCASNKIGARFTTAANFCSSIIDNNPAIYSDSIIVDSLNWTRISGSFIADSSYTYLVIGNFFDDWNTDTSKFFNSWWSDFAYYYLDDVCVSTDSIYSYNYSYTGIALHSKEEFECFPNPFNEKITIQNLGNGAMDIEIYNSLGQQIMIIEGVQGSEIVIDGVSIPAGMIFIRVISNGHFFTYTLLKQ